MRRLTAACLLLFLTLGGMDMENGHALSQSVNSHDKTIDESLLKIKDLSELFERQKGWKSIWLDMLGGLPSEKTPLSAETTRTVQFDGYKIEYVLFQSQPGIYVTAYLYLPDTPQFKPPYSTVLQVNGHTDIGKRGGTYRTMPIKLVKEGFAVFTVDPISQGERVQRGKKYPVPNCANEHASIGARSWLVGWNFARFRIWDAIRSIDYLETRKELDLSRLAITGVSGGGTLSTYMQALDDRIRISCPASYVSSMREVIGDRRAYGMGRIAGI